MTAGGRETATAGEPCFTCGKTFAAGEYHPCDVLTSDAGRQLAEYDRDVEQDRRARRRAQNLAEGPMSAMVIGAVLLRVSERHLRREAERYRLRARLASDVATQLTSAFAADVLEIERQRVLRQLGQCENEPTTVGA